MKNIKISRVIRNIFLGASTGLTLWILDWLFNRVFGFESPFFTNAPQFILAGMTIGAIIGAISDEIHWNNKNK